MNKARSVIASMLMIALASIGMTTQAQRRQTNRLSDRQMQELHRRVETSADNFRRSLDAALDRSRLDGTNREDNINDLVSDFENQTDQLRDRFSSRQAVTADVEAVLERAGRIGEFMQRSRLTQQAQGDWTLLQADLNALARAYGVRPLRNNAGNNGAYSRDPGPNSAPNSGSVNQDPFGRGRPEGVAGDGRLTGTYRLDATRSDNPRYAAERASRSVPNSERQNVYTSLMARLDPPDQLAIQQQDRNVTIASSRAPQITFEADGRERVEQTSDGRSVRARAVLAGEQLTVSSTGDRYSDFTVTFEPLEQGRSLRVTRRISAERLAQPVVIRSIYSKTADVARLDLYGSEPAVANNNGGRNNETPRTTTANNSGFIVPNNTTLVAILDKDLSTKESRENDRFTMTVREPSQFEGAVVEGYISRVNPSGRVSGRSEMTFNFERIQMRDGRTSKFAGFIESVRTAGGETVRVDNEGGVEENKSQTERTVQRAAIGTAIGAIIGAIAGGGKGAAIGAVVGAGAGAGSVYVQGSGDLQIASGSEVTIRSSSPR
ncbi:MAG: hypothetical protein H0T92_12840 [Pyrinomonadaceae bacterium]|nr:hypothetical protein [Pyrinomonadaceae bacterium]